MAFRQQHPSLEVSPLHSSSAARAVHNNQAAAKATGDVLAQPLFLRR